MIDVVAYNQQSWDKRVEQGDKWSQPVTSTEIDLARQGQWAIKLTATQFTPADWFPPLAGLEVLALASGGGQQAPILAAAGARVTVMDNSPKQLAQDQFVAERDNLPLTIVAGSMTDLGQFANASFDLIFHPVANVYVPDIQPIWQETFRVLRPGGLLLAGFMQPTYFIFDETLMDEQDILQVRYAMPYSDLTSISEMERNSLMAEGFSLKFGHTLADQIGGQLQAGFMLTGFYEDYDNSPLKNYLPVYGATRAIKPEPK